MAYLFIYTTLHPLTLHLPPCSTYTLHPQALVSLCYTYTVSTSPGALHLPLCATTTLYPPALVPYTCLPVLHVHCTHQSWCPAIVPVCCTYAGPISPDALHVSTCEAPTLYPPIQCPHESHQSPLFPIRSLCVTRGKVKSFV